MCCVGVSPAEGAIRLPIYSNTDQVGSECMASSWIVRFSLMHSYIIQDPICSLETLDFSSILKVTVAALLNAIFNSIQRSCIGMRKRTRKHTFTLPNRQCHNIFSNSLPGCRIGNKEQWLRGRESVFELGGLLKGSHAVPSEATLDSEPLVTPGEQVGFLRHRCTV